MASIKDQHYFHINQSQGGIFKFPLQELDGSTLNCVGTYDCWTCVCTYIPLDDKTCFAAHIDAWVRPGCDCSRVSIPPPGTEDELKDCVQTKLKHALDKHLAPDLHKRLREEGLSSALKKRAIILNLRPTLPFNDTITKASGFYIAQAIREFFQIPESDEDSHAIGFVANHVTGETEFFGWNGDEAAPTSADFNKWQSHSSSGRTPCEEELKGKARRQFPDMARQVFKAQGVSEACDSGREWMFVHQNGLWRSKSMRDLASKSMRDLAFSW